MRILAILLMLLGLFMGGCAILVLADGVVGNPFAVPATIFGLAGAVLTGWGYATFRRSRPRRRSRPDVEHPDFTGLP